MLAHGPGSGTYAIDEYRQTKGDEALATLKAGRGLKAVTATHLSNTELCVEVLARVKSDDTHCVSDAILIDTLNKACDRLVEGKGHHVNKLSHTGSNTCIAVIAAATS